jgi:hypothetical protein
MIFKAGEWRITGSSGESVTAGTPNMKIQVGGSRLNLPLENKNTGEKTALLGYGLGGTFGLSLLEIPFTDLVNASISTKDMPSDGLGVIYRKEEPKRAYRANDFTGLLTVVSGGGTVSAITGEISIAIWQRYPLEQCIVKGLKNCEIIKSISNTTLMLNPSTMPIAISQAIHAIGFFTGVSTSVDMLGVGVNAFTYNMTV